MDNATESTALTIPQRAAVALNSKEHEVKLRELVKEAIEITTITNADSYKQLHATRMRLKNERVQLTKEGKDARDDAAKFAKGVIAEEARLIAIIEPEEKRLETMQREWDDARERERVARVEAEQNRIALIRMAIDEIGAIGLTFTEKTLPLVVENTMKKLLETAITKERFHELEVDAANVKAAVMQRLNGQHVASLAYEADARQRAAEKAELERLKKEAAERERLEAERERERKAEHDRIETEARLRREAEDRKAKEARDEQDRLARIAQDARERELQERQDKINREARELEDRQRKAREEQETRDREARDKKEAAEREHRSMCMSEIEGIRQQEIIAQIGRAGVRTGHSLECLQETLEETKVWPVEEDHFGVHFPAATYAKREVIHKIEQLIEGWHQRQAEKELQATADAEQLLRTFVEKYGDVKRWKPIVKVIKAVLDPRVKAAANE